MSARFFYAPKVAATWPKLYVMTEDGTLYCEYLNFMQSARDIQHFDYQTFRASDYKWSGYQPLQEIDYKTANDKPLIRQANWVENYVRTKGIEVLSNPASEVSSPSSSFSNPEFQGIMSFGRYFEAGTIEKGIHGPEINNGKLYMSIFHYLEYMQMGPRSYDTFKLGNYLTGRSAGDYQECKYDTQHFHINKFNLELLKREMPNFRVYRKSY